MKIAMIGAGNVGGALGVRWAKLGHEVVFGVRDPGADKVQTLLERAGHGARAASIREACEGADAVLLATPWAATQEALAGAGDLSGKVLMDATNPLAPGLTGLTLGHDNSAAEQVAAWAPDAKVVKAFNTTGSTNMQNATYPGNTHPFMPICGDDEDAKALAMSLAQEIGFEAVDVGPLTGARLLEPMAMLWIHMAFKNGFGMDYAYGLLRR